MKQRIAIFCFVFLLFCTAAGFSVQAKTQRSPIYPSDLQEGTYAITVDSSSSMFRVIACELTVSDGTMTAVMTLSGQGYGKLFLGTGEAAAKAPESSYIPFVENDAGKYTYRVPVAALNLETDCAAYSIRKDRWYDRVLVFESDSLPESAFRMDRDAKWIVELAVRSGTVLITEVMLHFLPMPLL